MNFTNNYGLPEGIEIAVKHDEYNIGNADFSFSNLNTPPQIKRIMQLKGDEITIDVADNLWAFFGKAIHDYIEKAERFKKEKVIVDEDAKTEEDKRQSVLEERYYMNVGGYIISGQMDRYNEKTGYIEDYKFTSGYKVAKGDYTDWINQLNVYNLILLSNGIKPKGARINALIRDWKQSDKDKYGDNYPPKAFKTIEIPLHDPFETMEFVIDRIKKHLAVKDITDLKELAEKSPCTYEERWGNPPKYVVTKIGSDRAVPHGTFDTEVAAKELLKLKGDGYRIIKKYGKYTRCQKQYCPAFDFCEQIKAENDNVIIAENNDLIEQLKSDGVIPEDVDTDQPKTDNSTEPSGIIDSVPSIEDEETIDKPNKLDDLLKGLL